MTSSLKPLQHTAMIELDDQYKVEGPYRYMRVAPKDLEEARHAHFLKLQSAFKQKYSLDPSDLSSLSVEKSHFIVNISKESEIKLSKDNIVATVENNWKYLDLSEVKECNLFCGQVVAVEGNCGTDQIHARSILSNAGLELRENLNWEIRNKGVKVVVASGPYLTPDLSLSQKFIDFLVKRRDSVIILLGPFLPDYYREIETTEETYDSHFMRIRNSIAQINAQVIMIPSASDVHHYNVMPQPPFSPVSSIQMFPNPCIFYVNDISFAVCTHDSISEITSQILIKGSISDKAALGMKMILDQSNFIPQFPTTANIDQQRYNDHLGVNFKPDVLIMATSMENFSKTIDDVVCIGAGPFLKYDGKINSTHEGSFCEIHIKETTDNVENIVGRTDINLASVKYVV